jgi:hypothetical protein
VRGHGRLTPFFQFLREKNFIRPIPKEELERLKSLVKVVRCSSCGAPIDLATSTACEFCRAPIAILDPEAASRAVRELASAAASTTTAPRWTTPRGRGRQSWPPRSSSARWPVNRRSGRTVLRWTLIEVGLTALAAVLMRALM